MKFMGLDIGTTGAKAAVFDERGAMLGYGFRKYPILFSHGRRAEQDADFVWEQAKLAIAEATAASGGDIASISVSAQGDAVIPIDRAGNPLHNCLLGMDYRSEEQAKFCEARFGAEELFLRTGMRPHPLNSITKILWFLQNRPRMHEAVYKYTTYADFMLLKLGADEPAVDDSMASRYMALDLETKAWSDAILNGLGIPKNLLSRPCRSGEIVGKIAPELCDLGIAPGALIVAGGHDQPCAALGAGIVAGSGVALDSHGTAEVLSTAFDAPTNARELFSGFYPCTLYVEDGCRFTFALNHTGGILLQWLLETLCEKDIERAAATGEDPYSHMIARMPMDRPSSVLALPHFNGSGTPTCDLRSKGAFVGLTMDTTREELAKAVVDALAYEMKINLAAFRSAGIAVDSVRCVGGAARSDAWLQLKADVLNVPVESLKTREAACLGAAMIAATAAGAFSSVRESLHMVKPGKRFLPGSARNRLYEERFQVYAGLYAALRETHHALPDAD